MPQLCVEAVADAYVQNFLSFFTCTSWPVTELEQEVLPATPRIAVHLGSIAISPVKNQAGLLVSPSAPPCTDPYTHIQFPGPEKI